MQRRRRFRRQLGNIVDSNKNVIDPLIAAAAGTTTQIDIADTQDSATLAVADDVERGCLIKAVWLEFWVRPTAEVAVGITEVFVAYVIKNPGFNLTPPNPATVGTSNEKKFIFKEWKGLIHAATQGVQPYSWKGWIKIPKLYQRMGANDKLTFVFRVDGVNSLMCMKIIYKWYK